MQQEGLLVQNGRLRVGLGQSFRYKCLMQPLLPHAGQNRAGPGLPGRTRLLRMDSMTSGGTSVTGFPRSSLPDTLSNLRSNPLQSPARSWRCKTPSKLPYVNALGGECTRMAVS